MSSKKLKLYQQQEVWHMTREDESKDVKCKICLDLLIEPVTYPCGHGSCKKCFDSILEKSNVQCPFCRKRLSTWSRKSHNELIDEKKWNMICKLYPDHVERYQSGQLDEDEFFDVDQIKRVISEPGEVKREFDLMLKREEMERENQRLIQEQKSLDFIRENFTHEAHLNFLLLDHSTQDQKLSETLQETKRRRGVKNHALSSPKQRPKRQGANKCYMFIDDDSDTDEY